MSGKPKENSIICNLGPYSSDCVSPIGKQVSRLLQRNINLARENGQAFSFDEPTFGETQHNLYEENEEEVHYREPVFREIQPHAFTEEERAAVQLIATFLQEVKANPDFFTMTEKAIKKAKLDANKNIEQSINQNLPGVKNTLKQIQKSNPHFDVVQSANMVTHVPD